MGDFNAHFVGHVLLNIFLSCLFTIHSPSLIKLLCMSFANVEDLLYLFGCVSSQDSLDTSSSLQMFYKYLMNLFHSHIHFRITMLINKKPDEILIGIEVNL